MLCFYRMTAVTKITKRSYLLLVTNEALDYVAFLTTIGYTGPLQNFCKNNLL